MPQGVRKRFPVPPRFTRIARYDMLCYDEVNRRKEKKKKVKAKAPETPRFPVVRGFPRKDVVVLFVIQRREKEVQERPKNFCDFKSFFALLRFLCVEWVST